MSHPTRYQVTLHAGGHVYTIAMHALAAPHTELCDARACANSAIMRIGVDDLERFSCADHAMEVVEDQLCVLSGGKSVQHLTRSLSPETAAAPGETLIYQE